MTSLQYNGRNYLISWQAAPNCKFTGQGAKAYCRSVLPDGKI